MALDPTTEKRSLENYIGGVALMRKENNNRGFWLALPWHRQGLMSEACEVVTDYWFDVLNEPVLRAEGGGEHGLASYFREERHATGRHRRARVCLRPSSHRDLGDHSG